MMRDAALALSGRNLRGKTVLVLGLGDTGLSVARWAESLGARVRAADTRAEPPRRAEFRGELHCGAFREALLEGVDLVCISPGLSLEQEIVRQAQARAIPVAGDVELFAWQARALGPARILAVTGTNGKSTVTALAGHLLRAAGLDCEVAGNIGPPVLEALARRAIPPAAWVLELSSFQLETTSSLAPDAAALLNLSEDHLDRYPDMAAYAAAKARIFLGSGAQVLNRDDPRALRAVYPDRGTSLTFGLDAPPRDQDFGLIVVNGAQHLAQGRNAILELAALPLHGMHNAANALAACALARCAGADYPAMQQGLATFRGLPHRLERVATRRGVDWYDDSKGTNVGAAAAALQGLGRSVVLILGGEGKGQDFSPLVEPVRRYAAHVLLIGRDAPLIEKALGGGERCASLEEAVASAARRARPGEAVLLSPACASFDMFRDYRQRGEAFAAAVRALGE